MRQSGKAAAWLSLAILLPTGAGAQASPALEAAIRARLARDTAVVGVAVHDPLSGLKVLLQADLRFHSASAAKDVRPERFTILDMGLSRESAEHLIRMLYRE